MNRFTITTPIFYVNAPPHIGHAYTVVAADVLARAHRRLGDQVFFLTGTDEHGTKIAEAAAAAGKEPQAFADEIAGTFKDAWNALDVQYDDFLRTTEPRHVAGVQHALRVLHERGHLYEKSYRGLYCTGCENFLTEKNLNGEGKCPLHNVKPVEVKEKNWFFRLSAFLPDVRRRIESDELRISPVERKNEVLGLLGPFMLTPSTAEGEGSRLSSTQDSRLLTPDSSAIADFSISRPASRVPWAIPLPFDSSQTCYVWVDALLNYVTALGLFGVRPDFSREKSGLTPFWPADLQIIGQDILKFHAVYWPALLLALDLPLPKEIFVHGFFTVNGQKISKSLGNAIDPLALVRRYGSDATRYLLLSQFPFGSSGDVNVSRFDEQYDAILANTIGNLVSRTIALVGKFSDGKVPEAESALSVILTPSAVEGEGSRAPSPTPDSRLTTLDSLVRKPVELAQSLNVYADRTAPWKESDPAKRAVALRTLGDGIAHLAVISAPLLPRTSAAIAKAFSVENHQPPKPGAPIRPTDPPILFLRLS